MGEEKNKNIEEIHKLLVKKEVENITLRRRSEFNEEKDPRIIKDYMERNNLEFFYAQVLKDDQGVVGVFSFEAEAENIINEQNHEILDILTAQSTVALSKCGSLQYNSKQSFCEEYQGYTYSSLNEFKRFIKRNLDETCRWSCCYLVNTDLCENSLQYVSKY